MEDRKSQRDQANAYPLRSEFRREYAPAIPEGAGVKGFTRRFHPAACPAVGMHAIARTGPHMLLTPTHYKLGRFGRHWLLTMTFRHSYQCEKPDRRHVPSRLPCLSRSGFFDDRFFGKKAIQVGKVSGTVG